MTLGQVVVRHLQLHSPNSVAKLRKAVPSDPAMIYVISTETMEDGAPFHKIRIAMVPKIIGIIDTMLVIFTSFGHIPVPVTAQVSPSHFRVFPIEHPRLPIWTNYSTDIVLFNPFDTTLLVSKVYSSGGPFHLFLPETLHLPTNQRFIPKKKSFWEIPGFESRVIASLFIEPMQAFREQTFVRVKFNDTDHGELFLPIDVNVWEGSGLYAVDGVLHFGVRRFNNGPIFLPLKLRLTENAAAVYIDDIIDASSNAGVNITIVQRHVIDYLGDTVVANVSLTVSEHHKSGIVNGNVVVKSSSGEFVVPYRAFVVVGDIIPSKDTNLWHLSANLMDASVETLYIKNGFTTPVTFLKILVTQNAAFSSVELIESAAPKTILPGEECAVGNFRVVVHSRITHTVIVRLITTLSVFEIPVTLYTGDLWVDLSKMLDVIHDGIVSGENYDRQIWIHNTNPVPVSVQVQRLQSDCMRVIRVAFCDAPDQCTKTAQFVNSSGTIRNGSALRLDVSIESPILEGHCEGNLVLKTPFQTLITKLDTAVYPGRIELYGPETPVIVEDIFPSSYAQRNLTVFSTFEKSIDILNIFSEEFPQLKMVPALDGIQIDPKTGLSFDTFTFDARDLCQQLPGLCYVGFNLESACERTETWKRPFRIINYSSVEIDRRFRERQRTLWNNISGGNDSFQIDTSVKVTTVQNYAFQLPITLKFIWPPSLISLSAERFEFPLLSIGNSSELDVEVVNPSYNALFVHAYVFKDDKSQLWNRDIFYVKSIVPKGTTTGFYGIDDERLPTSVRMPAPTRGTAALVIPPRGNFLVRIAFQPQAETCYNALLYIRNNLTVVETVNIHGCGVEPNVRISSENISSETKDLSILFTAVDAVYCRNKSPINGDRKQIRRIGKMIIHNPTGAYVAVDKVMIDETDWYHKSFAVLDSGPFIVPPKKSRKVSVEFNPDFGVHLKTAKAVVFLRDRSEPVYFQITGEVDARAAKLCRSVFGRSERDIWIRYILFTKRWGWTFYFIPLILLGFYVLYIRKWYTRRLRDQFIRRFTVQFTQERRKSEGSTKPKVTCGLKPSDFGCGESRQSDYGTVTKRKTNRCREGGTLRETSESPSKPGAQSFRSLRQLIESEIPEDLWELCAVAYYASSPVTYVINFRFPQRSKYRVFFLLETVAWPARGLFWIVSRAVQWLLAAFGYRLQSSDSTEFDTPLIFDKYMENGTVSKAYPLAVFGWIFFWNWNFSRWFCAIFRWNKTMSEPVVEVAFNVNVVESVENIAEVVALKPDILGKVKERVKALNSDITEHAISGSSWSNPETVDEGICSGSESKNRSMDVFADYSKRDVAQQQLVSSSRGVDSPRPTSSRESSVDDELRKSCDETDRAASPDGGNGFKTARKMRRRQLLLAKREADKAAKLAKNYNKAQRKAEERKLLDAKAQRILAVEDGEVTGGADSEFDTDRERNLAAKRRAKQEAEKIAAKLAERKKFPTMARVVSPSFDINHHHPHHNNRPVTYPPQCDVIQHAFYRVEPKENGLMFTEMNRDQSLQLVKQLKRDHPNLFTLDPKTAVDLLIESTKTNRYRIDGDYVDLAKKSNVIGYTSTNRRRSQEAGKSLLKQQPVYSSIRRASPPNPWNTSVGSTASLHSKPLIDDRWSGSQSPNGSDNGSWEFSRADSRLSPLSVTYADVAGTNNHQPLSRKSSNDNSIRNTASPWRSSHTPSGTEIATSGARFMITAKDPVLECAPNVSALVSCLDDFDMSSDLADFDSRLEQKFGKKANGKGKGGKEKDLTKKEANKRVDSSHQPVKSTTAFSLGADPQSVWLDGTEKDNAKLTSGTWESDLSAVWQTSISSPFESWHASDITLDCEIRPFTWNKSDTTKSEILSTLDESKSSAKDYWSQSVWNTSSFFLADENDKASDETANSQQQTKIGVIGDCLKNPK
ncbi:uncharacterized protein LOC129589291 isoform X2 [Paramacrobiotus metropolitanus]|nr:uncharacterized protein LOC129589291 isoform X2 [Paramacrobiotus metropolitanus]XP_055339948.1 uncharacterized protein LOC129589291 isoform X2 [Paramacrobiotus metropolitanus]